MPTFDVSSNADLHPVEALRVMRRELGDFMIIGAVAVDVITHDLAGLPLGRITRDVDIALAVADQSAFETGVRRLGGTPGASARLEVERCRVDVVPFGPWAHDDVVEHDGVKLTVVGLAEAYRTADVINFGPEVTLRVPTLAGLVALKTIAWQERRGGTAKDAGDLARLLRASRSGPYGDALWADEVALAAGDFDPIAAGPWRVGRTIAETFEPRSRAQVGHALSGDPVQWLIADAGGQFTEAATELDALRRGLESIS